MFRANWVGRRLITTSYFGVNRRVHWERAPCKASTRQETICPMGSPWVFGCLATLASLKLVSWCRMVHVVFCLQEDATLLVLVCQEYGMHTWCVKQDDLHNERSAHFNQKKPMLPSRGKKKQLAFQRWADSLKWTSFVSYIKYYCRVARSVLFVFAVVKHPVAYFNYTTAHGAMKAETISLNK